MPPEPKNLALRDEIFGYLVSTIRMPVGFPYVYETNVRHPNGTWGSFVRGTDREVDALSAHAAAVAFVRGKIQ